jgi:hypothetical protein
LYELDHEALLLLIDECLVRGGDSEVSRAEAGAEECMAGGEGSRTGIEATPHVLLSFQPHDPVHLPKQLRFFQMAQSHPFYLRVTPLAAARAPKMFPRPEGMSDEEDEQSRRVYLFALSRAPVAQQDVQYVGLPLVLPEPEGWVDAESRGIDGAV